MDFPSNAAPMPVVVNSLSKYFHSAATFNSFNVSTIGTGSSPGSTTSPMMPFTIPSPYLVKSLFIANGITATGNTDIGIYQAGATTAGCSAVVTAGSVAMSGANVLQIRTLATPVLLPPGSYYLAVYNSTSGTFNGVTLTAVQASQCGLLETPGALSSTVSLQRSTGLHYYLAGFSRLASGY